MNRWLWSTALAGMACAAAVSGAVAQTREFNIPQGEMAGALDSYARQSDQQVMYRTEDVRGLRTAGAQGRMESSQALERLLAGSGLTVRRDASGAIAIVRDVPPARRNDVNGDRPPVATAPSEVGEVVVTASRIDRAFTAPTPTLGLNDDELRQGDRVNIGAVLNDLPQFRATRSPQSTGTNFTAGSAPVDLRGLGLDRTLVLLDGRRFSSQNDLNTLPMVLVKRVDVVTGGASAAWGSGAVAGVVNIVLDDRREGFEMAVSGGIAEAGDADQFRFEAGGGLSFAGGRGHILAGGEYLSNIGVVPRTDRARIGRWSTVANPNYTATNGQHAFMLAGDVGFSNASYGGLITSGVLRGQTFNPDGTLRPFQQGVVVGASMIGGEGPSNDNAAALVTPQKHYNGLFRVSYDLTDTLKATAEVRRSRAYNDYPYLLDASLGNITIRNDNAFLSSAIKAQMATAGQTSFTLGRANLDLGLTRLVPNREATQGTLALDGRFGAAWRWTAYYTHGQYEDDLDITNLRIASNFTNALDSVISPATGRPVCRIALTNPNTNCVPLNPLGFGAPSAEAVAHVTGTGTQRQMQMLDVGGASLRGELLTLPAGDVSMAVGFEARKEEIKQDVGALDSAAAFAMTNFSRIQSSSYTVKEAFGEVLVPLVKDLPLLQDLSVNTAARISDYSTSGSIWSWKVGATNQLVDGVRIRATRSRDIRSANLLELFTTQGVGFSTVADPVKGQSVLARVNVGGNPGLEPEKADTTTVGVILEPRWLPGFQVSLDYYSIDVSGVIVRLSAQDIVTRCANGNLEFCARVTRDAAGVLTAVDSRFVNLSSYKTRGVDLDARYVLPFQDVGGPGGRVSLRGVATYTDRLTTNDGISRISYVGSQGSAFALGVPRLRANLTAAYDLGPLRVDARVRYVSAGNYNKLVDLQNGDIPAFAYVDTNASYDLSVAGRKVQVFGSIVNLFDKAPPKGSTFSVYYDVVGRYYTLGARVAF